MPIYEFNANEINRVSEISFEHAGIQERRDLQRLLRENIDVITPNVLVIAEEFGDWNESKRRIDLLCIDKNANLVIIELKRTEDGGHMELQAIRYAAMVSTMTYDQAVDVFGRHLEKMGRDTLDPRSEILEFLEWEGADEDHFGQKVRIILASAEFSKELTSSVLWLADCGIDICCVRLKPYNLDGRLLVDVQQIIPLPEAAEYQVQVREKTRKERQAKAYNVDFTRFDIQFQDEKIPGMWKRQAILIVCKRLCENGVSPEEIIELFDWRAKRVWFSLPGKLDAEHFENSAYEESATSGKKYDPRRWFAAENELVYSNGKTYAFSNQWGGKRWHKAMELLKEKYSRFNIEYTPLE